MVKLSEDCCAVDGDEVCWVGLLLVGDVDGARFSWDLVHTELFPEPHFSCRPNRRWISLLIKSGSRIVWEALEQEQDAALEQGRGEVGEAVEDPVYFSESSFSLFLS